MKLIKTRSDTGKPFRVVVGCVACRERKRAGEIEKDVTGRGEKGEPLALSTHLNEFPNGACINSAS